MIGLVPMSEFPVGTSGSTVRTSASSNRLTAAGHPNLSATAEPALFTASADVTGRDIGTGGHFDGQPGSARQDARGDRSYNINVLPDCFTFRDFTLMPRMRQLRRNNQVVEIGSRAFDLLTLLASARGELVTKDQMFSYVWPSTLVDESNLRFQMGLLRKSLGYDRDMIKTIPGRGYILLAEDDVGQSGDEIGPPALQFSDVVKTRVTTQGQKRQGADSVTPLHELAPDIVLIDDDEDVVEALCAFFNHMGFSIEAHRSVQSFVETQPKLKPRCLILEVWLPGQSGLDFQADLLRSGRETPVIFITGHADVHISVRAMKAGAVDFLTKPLRHEELLTAVKSALRRETRADSKPPTS